MEKIDLKRYLAKQEQKRQEILNSFSRGRAAYDLANLALEHTSRSAEAAARLLLSMELDQPFDFKFLLRFDAENRAKADLVMAGYQPHNLWPSGWIDKEGFDGFEIIARLREKWYSALEESQ